VLWQCGIQSKGMLMQKKTLTLKPRVSTSQTTDQSAIVQAGRKPSKGAKAASAALLDQLHELVCARHKAFIQMRHGAGYCGIAAQLNDGWIKMEQVSIYGTKQTATTPYILIQINDGRFIAHIHLTDSTDKLRTFLGVKS